jgi:hypothetical protein
MVAETRGAVTLFRRGRVEGGRHPERQQHDEPGVAGHRFPAQVSPMRVDDDVPGRFLPQTGDLPATRPDGLVVPAGMAREFWLRPDLRVSWTNGATFAPAFCVLCPRTFLSPAHV